MLETVKLTKRFNGHVAGNELNLAIKPGEVFALLGPNGAGKTTTINLLLGFLTPDAGEARVSGASVAADMIAARRHIAYIPEQVMLYPRFGVDQRPTLGLNYVGLLDDLSISNRPLTDGEVKAIHQAPGGVREIVK